MTVSNHARFQGGRGNTWTAPLPLSEADQRRVLTGELTPVCDHARRYADQLHRQQTSP